MPTPLPVAAPVSTPVPMPPAAAPPSAPVASAPVVTEASPVSRDTTAIDELLRHMVAAGASDLHLSAGAVPVLRVHGEIKFLSERGALGSDDVEKLVYSIMEDDVRNTFEQLRGCGLRLRDPGCVTFSCERFRRSQRPRYGDPHDPG